MNLLDAPLVVVNKIPVVKKERTFKEMVDLCARNWRKNKKNTCKDAWSKYIIMEMVEKEIAPGKIPTRFEIVYSGIGKPIPENCSIKIYY